MGTALGDKTPPLAEEKPAVEEKPAENEVKPKVEGEAKPKDDKTEEKEPTSVLGTGTEDKDSKTEESEGEITYEAFDLPEGITIDEARLEKVTPILKELNLDQGKAQQVVSLYAELRAEDESRQKQEFLDMRKDWLKQLDNHPDFGGPKAEETKALAAKVVQRFGGDELKQVMNETGMGDHWALIVAFARVGQLLNEDQLVTAGSKVKSERPLTDSEIFYPNQAKKT